MVNINIQIPEELHKKIKIICAVRGISLKDLVIEVLQNHVENSGSLINTKKIMDKKPASKPKA